MRPLTPVVLTSVTTSAWLPVDVYSPAQGSVNVTSSGTATYQVDYTLDDVFNPAVTPVSAGTVIASGTAATASGVVPAGARAVRLNVTAYTNGNVTLRVSQQSLL